MPTDVPAIQQLLETPLVAMIHSAPDAILLVDRAGIVAYANPATERLFGFVPDEIVGSAIEILIPERLRALHVRQRLDYSERPVARLMGSGLELAGRRKDGSEFPIDVMLQAIVHGDQQLLAAQVRDMTQQKRLEQDLRVRNAELETAATLLDNILESSTEYSIIAKDLDGRILTWNHGAYRLYGYTREEVLERGLRSTALHTPEDTESGAVEALYRDVRQYGTVERRMQRVRKNGDRFTASLSVSLRRDADGNPIGYLVISKDITEQQRLEQQVTRSNEEIKEQYSRLEQANRLKSEFLANMSHELRTPLNAIIGFAEIMHDGRVGELAPEHQEFMGDILTSARHLLQLINDVLDLAKIEAGRMEFHPEPVHLGKLIAEVCDVVRSMSSRKRLRIATRVDDALDDVVLDSGKLKQVLYNYLSNAIKFTNDGGYIEVSATAEDPARFRLAVADTGIGIAPDQLDLLFMEFKQLDSTLTKRFQGTGLGLALTRRIVEAQHGRVGVDSTPGKGSCFYAVLPRRADVRSSAGAGEAPYAVRAPAGANCILVVEDDRQDAVWLQNILGEAGYSVEVAPSGAQALALCQERCYTAITLDLLLPDTTGWELLRRIRAEGLNVATPVVVHSIVADRAAGSVFSIQDYLVKPSSAGELLAALHRCGVGIPPARRLLILDRDADALRSLQTTLGHHGYQLFCTADGAEALQIIEHQQPDAMLIDPLGDARNDEDRAAFMAALRATCGGRSLPVFVYTDLQPAENSDRQAELAAALSCCTIDMRAALLNELRGLLGDRRAPADAP
jgi:PAS domain S-box-containing protein